MKKQKEKSGMRRFCAECPLFCLGFKPCVSFSELKKCGFSEGLICDWKYGNPCTIYGICQLPNRNKFHQNQVGMIPFIPNSLWSDIIISSHFSGNAQVGHESTRFTMVNQKDVYGVKLDKLPEALKEQADRYIDSNDCVIEVENNLDGRSCIYLTERIVFYLNK